MFENDVVKADTYTDIFLAHRLNFNTLLAIIAMMIVNYKFDNRSDTITVKYIITFAVFHHFS